MKSSQNDKSSPLLWLIINQLDRLDTRIIKIQAKTEARQKQIAGINTRIGQIQDKTKARQKQITEINTKINKIQDKTEAKQKQITGINTRIDNIQKKNAVLNAKVLVLQTDVRKLKDRCDNGWKFYGNHCYLFGFNKINWHDAKKECEGRQSHLVKIDSSAENSWLGSEFLNTGINDYALWIGANDLIQEGKWTWISDHSTIGYSYWHTGQPSNTWGVEDCGQLFKQDSHTWNDAPCSHRCGYICEKW